MTINNNNKLTCPHCLHESNEGIFKPGYHICGNCENTFQVEVKKIVSYKSSKK